jgi:energy-converting hydrogenase Eha subunit A
MLVWVAVILSLLGNVVAATALSMAIINQRRLAKRSWTATGAERTSSS